MKVLLTGELGRLARWLRILGVDAEYSRENSNASLMIRALREDRVILTRNHRLPASRGIKIVVLKEELLKKQLAEIFNELGLADCQAGMFTRCTICNETLVSIAKEKAEEKVPEYVLQTQENFFTCPKCSRIYWQGTHWGNVRQLLEEIKG
jgi:hypothetical protein